MTMGPADQPVTPRADAPPEPPDSAALQLLRQAEQVADQLRAEAEAKALTLGSGSTPTRRAGCVNRRLVRCSSPSGRSRTRPRRPSSWSRTRGSRLPR